MENEKTKITGVDIRIAVSILLCCITAVALDVLGIKFSFGEMKLEIIQKMTTCIACLLCCQDSTKISFKAGINRLIITAIGGGVGLIAVLCDNALQNEWLMVCLIFAGVLATLLLCKVAKVPYINARIGGVTFILVSYTLSGPARFVYAIFRLVSTFYGVFVVLAVTWVWEKIIQKNEVEEA